MTEDPQHRPHSPHDNDPDKGKRPRSGLSTVMMAIIVVLVVMVVISMFGEDGALGNREEVQQIQFWELLYTGQIKTIEQEGELRLHGERISPGTPPFTVEFPAGVLADRYDEISRLIATPFHRLPSSEFVSSLKDERLQLREAYTVSSGMDQNGTGKLEVYARILWRGQAYGDGPRLGYWQIGGGDSAPMVLEEIARAAPGLEVKDFNFPNGDALKSTQPNTWMAQLLYTLAPWLLIIGLFWFFLMRQMRSPGGSGGVLSFGRSRAQMVSKEKSTVTFADVAGIDEAKEEVSEIIEFLKNPARFSRLGGRIPRGVLLVGPPGTGKTLLAKAIAGEANVPFFSISGSDFVEMFVGVGASRVRDLFRQAREHSPCLVFLDEIDAVGRKRGSGLGGGHDEREQTLNAILVEMDGFETDVGIILVAATNRPDVLDAALLRPGRFDRQISVGLPDLKGREEILAVHTRKIKISPDVAMTTLARATPGFSGAELAAIVNEAALIATLKNRDSVELPDFEEARDKVRWGREKKNHAMEEKDRLVTAYHEAGHALVAHLLPEVEPLHKVTIIPRGLSLGATMVLPERDRYNQKKNEVLGFIKFAYGGRCAEEIFCDDITTGAYDDIKRATELARQMVCQWGMSDNIGPIAYAENADPVFLGQELARTRTHSESMSVEIDQEIKRILLECHDSAKRTLTDNRQALEAVAMALMKFETLSGVEVQAIIDGKDLEEIRREEESKAEAQRKRRRTEDDRAKEKSQEEGRSDGLGDFGPPQPEPA